MLHRPLLSVHRTTRVSWVLLVFLLGCGSASGPISTSDALDSAGELWDGTIILDAQDIPGDPGLEFNGDGLLDIDPFADAQPGKIGYPCYTGSDCDSGFCVPFGDGSVCTQFCEEECPGDWLCKAVSSSYPDVVFVCVPYTSRLCANCNANTDCAAQGDLCVSIGEGDAEGTYCLVDCSVTGLCPEGYSCIDILTTTGGLRGRQCYPDTDSCICKPGIDQTTRTCSHANRYGTCFGLEMCDGASGWVDCDAAYPITEKCDGEDNDCNNQFDEVFYYQEIDGSIRKMDESCGQGRCAGGTVICATAVTATCSSLGEAIEETCNGEDDDCDGTIDDDNPFCPSYSCVGGENDYFEVGQSHCEEGQCLSDWTKGCGAYTCEGGGDQGDHCAVTCGDDSVCVASAHCDEDTNECVADLPAGAPCSKDSYCLSGHCGNGFCCVSGDCCAQPVDCPASYSHLPLCDDPGHCQGHRADVTCESNQCVGSGEIDDDSACGASLVAMFCNPYKEIRCSGATEQPALDCPTGCTEDEQCLSGFHCDNTCVPNVAAGSPCDEHSDCQTGHCQNGFCCSSGDCCADEGDCSPDWYAQESTCVDVGTCSGARNEPECKNYSCRLGDPISDDTGCLPSTQASDCGPYPAMFCNGNLVQTAPGCATSCTQDSDCDAEAHCDGDKCVWDLTAGQYCDEPTDCASGLYCVDGVCCTSLCNSGLCQRCDLAGTLGTCSNIPDGLDPDSECPAISCEGYYYGWNGDSCLRRSDLAQHLAYCNGSGACHNAEDTCPTRPSGPAVKTCSVLCQDPDPTTCTGQVAPVCTNVPGGTITCGTGICFNAVDKCVDGALNVCVPLQGTAEVCNNIDDNCDNQIDNVATAPDAAQEPNGACLQFFDLGTLNIGDSKAATGAVYPVNDIDFYRIQVNEQEDWCIPGRTQDYHVTLSATPPPGEDCISLTVQLWSDTCNELFANLVVDSCAEKSITYQWQGKCAQNDDRYFKVLVEGGNSQSECKTYSLQVSYDQD